MNDINEEIGKLAENTAGENESADAAEAAAGYEDPGNDEKAETAEKTKKPFSDALDWVNCIVYAVTAMLVLNLFFFRSITVDGPSMLNTLESEDKVVATNFCYTPAYGDIVVIQADKLKNRVTDMWGEPIIKRVIAVGGDTIRIDFTKGEVYRNGELLEEDYIKDPTFFRANDSWMEGNREYTVPENTVFVMGDNRGVSNDSRNLPQVGFVDTRFIMGKAFVRVSPIEKFKWL